MSRLSILKSFWHSQRRDAPVLGFLALIKQKRGSSAGTQSTQKAAEGADGRTRMTPAHSPGKATTPDERPPVGKMDGESCGSSAELAAVLEEIERLSKSGSIDGHDQEALIRILRHEDNNMIREAAIHALPMVPKPSAALIDAVLAILMCADLPCGLRICATESLGRMLRKEPQQGRPNFVEGNGVIGKVIEGMSRLLMEPQPPILNRALRESIDRIVNG
jgi:hypothetical protein